MINCDNTLKKINKLVVLTDEEKEWEKAKELSEELCIEITDKMPDMSEGEMALRLDATGLALLGDGKMLQGDFGRMTSRIKLNNLNGELLVKAAKIKGVDSPLTIVDATAGLGEDSFLLAAAGFNVSLYEYDMVIAALLEDALYRASMNDEIADIAARMKLCKGDSQKALRNMSKAPNVVLLDPMFPARKKSGLIGKKFQLLQQLELPCSDEIELLDAALLSKPRKIVIKRPLKGPFLADRKPDYSLKGKAIRYDCILMPQNDLIL